MSMGFELPSPNSPAAHARALMARKDALEAELRAQGDVLRTQGVDMRSPLVDADGFPRADIDIYVVRRARVRIIELRNDLSALTDELAKALQGVYDPALRAPAAPTEQVQSDELRPFARVNGVLSASPASEAVCCRSVCSPNERLTLRSHLPGTQAWRSHCQIWPPYTYVLPFWTHPTGGVCRSE
jgi:26S proteasome regulatory subunit N4